MLMVSHQRQVVQVSTCECHCRDAAVVRCNSVLDGAQTRDVDDVKTTDMQMIDTNIVWVVPCLQQKQNVNTAILTDMDYIFRLLFSNRMLRQPKFIRRSYVTL